MLFLAKEILFLHVSFLWCLNFAFPLAGEKKKKKNCLEAQRKNKEWNGILGLNCFYLNTTVISINSLKYIEIRG